MSTLAAQECWQPDAQIGPFRFSIPAGWKRVQARDMPTLVPGDLPQGAVAHIGLLPAQVLSGDFRRWFDATWAQWLQEFNAIDGYSPEAARSADGFATLRAYTRITSPQFGTGVFVLAAARVGSRVQAYYFVDNSGRSSYLEIDLPNFEHSVRLATGPVTAAADTTGVAGGLDGLYIGYRLRGATPSEETHFEYLVFFPDGTAIRFLPEQGLEHFDFAAEVKASPDYCGCYRVRDGRVTLRWGDNATEVAAVGAAPERTLQIAGDSYFPVSKSDGLTLDGTYRREGEDLARYAFQFTADGRFSENGMLSLVAYGGRTSPRAAAPTGSLGTP